MPKLMKLRSQNFSLSYPFANLIRVEEYTYEEILVYSGEQGEMLGDRDQCTM